MEYSIKIFDRRTELTFTPDIDIEFIKSMLNSITRVNVTPLEFGRYRLDKRLNGNQKRLLNKSIRKQFNIVEPVRNLPGKTVKTHVKTDTINGFKGCPITGFDFEFNYC